MLWALRAIRNMNQDEAKKYLESLTNKQLVELMSEVFKTRRCDEGTEEAYIQAHWCIAEASRFKTDDGKGWESWEVELLALHDNEQYEGGWSDASPICQGGECTECGTKLFGWAKHIICPVCGAKAYAT
ncbi:hypothetical protein BTA51_28110 [Hahella sp. CCB-MM4]|uniref:hypothetical protein n=1 Tax=Hahella sp. (strain CCB-MM4) TaxID=1926491 RepID=UPI000B9BCA42|nr:hypothetical protein [Hahella sp. CCB-MM4]OZG69995.1 hypothetical protein BTA51_28110 [Hahella sp. CCB-MM4]